MKGNEGFASKHRSAIGLFMALLVLTLIFVASFRTIFKVDYGNLSGSHSWLSGSTIKFVNNWLAETPQKLHFVNFESPDSIEFNNIVERAPYISYPSGSTLFVYCAAKLARKSQITVYFLKHFQMLCFWLEVMLLAIFVYRFLARNRAQSKFEQFLIAIATATFWSWLPVNAWYLANVYFADQCVILFVMAFLLLEYEIMWCENKFARLSLNIMKSLVVFAGVLTDYYFWILVFVAFVLSTIRGIREKENLAFIAKRSLWYVVPVLLALGFFLYQLVSIPNWRGILKYKFLYRAGIAENEYNTAKNISTSLFRNFTSAFGLFGNLSSLLIICLIFYLQVQKTKSSDKTTWCVIKDSVSGKNGTILIMGFMSPILQIALLKNHSAVHEFSMIKLGWCFAMTPLAISALLCKTTDFSDWKHSVGRLRFSPFFHFFIICFVTMLVLTKVPVSAYKFYKSRTGNVDYHLAKILRDNARYEHICFSFSHDIPNNPPHELAVSKKRVYKIKCAEDMNTRFPRLRPDAVKLFIIDKNKSKSLTNEQVETETSLIEANEIFYKDDRYMLLLIENIPNEN